jgi:saxitoxin biosynthesis operon SxtJ-like protein
LETGIPAGLTPAEGRKFGLLVGGAFLVFGGISYWRGHDVAPTVLWVLGGTLVVAGLLIPGHLGPVYRGWMKLAVVLAKITTPILMALIYFLVFTPIGIIRRLMGRNELIRPQGNSFWITRDPGPGRRSDLSRQF